MSEAVIQVEKLGKRFHIGKLNAATTLRDALTNALKAPFRRRTSKEDTILWALRDVSFEVKQGEVIGLIGRNGAGKSTLLKILARITRPTEGSAQLKGRVGSLLEVGTGFHPELSGRENIFLSGATLGMKKTEIQKKFDEIVAFSEVERFLDTSLKHYSSGMQMRLAFAVAAHLEPEILLVDEVLAVGDASFQKKCLGKMRDVACHGRTIVFVSHNIGAIRTLCDLGFLLENGNLVSSGPIEQIISSYIDDGSDGTSEHTVWLQPAPSRCSVWMEAVSVLRNGEPSSVLETGDRIALRIRFRSREPIDKPIAGFLIKADRGENALSANNYFLPSASYDRPVTEGALTCELGAVPFMAGSYSVSFWLCRSPFEQHHVEDVLHFTVGEKDIWGNGVLPARNLSCLWWPTEFNYSDV